MKYDIKGCERLANAIIKGACNEYCTAKKMTLIMLKHSEK